MFVPGHLIATTQQRLARQSVEPQPLEQGGLTTWARAVGTLVGERGRHPDRSVRVGMAVVVHDQRRARVIAVRVREHVLVHAAVVVVAVVEPELARPREQRPAVQQRHEPPPVFALEPLVDRFIAQRAAELHAITFFMSFDLAVPEHRQTRHGRHEHADAEVLLAASELIDRRALVGIVQEVHPALQDVGVELERVAQHPPVVGVALVAQHHHERAVVDAVHAEGADEVALHEPERLGQQQRAGRLHRDAIHDLAPELLRHEAVELRARHAEAGAGRDVAAMAGLGEPQPLDVLLRQRHGGIEADDRETTRHSQDRLDHGLARRGVQVVELRGVVPREARAVVAVVEVARVPGRAIDAPKDHRGVAAIPVVVLDAHRDAVVVRQFRALERVRGVGTVGALQEPLGVLQHPTGVDAHMVRHHVAREPDTTAAGAFAEPVPGVLAAQLVCDGVVVHGVRRCRGIGVAGVLLDAAGRRAALPDADQPQRGDPERRQPVEFGVRYLIEARDRAAVAA